MESSKLFTDIFDAILDDAFDVIDPIAEMIATQVDLDHDMVSIINEHFWELI